MAISAREGEVLAAVGEHLTNAEIAARLFISVRTVESHVSSLLRKLQVEDRRALAGLSARRAPSGRGRLPTPLTPFVGRRAERAALSAALREGRLVTAVGPGGVGKTRLALSVAAEVSDRYVDGVGYIDLVPVTDPVMIAAAVADALGVGEGAGRSALDSVLSRLADRQVLLVLDNCEHLLDGLVALVERLLAGSPGLSVLATSRARLLVPFERVFPVPGLSVEAVAGRMGDAVELFLGRVTAGGSQVATEAQPRVGALCRALDGMALAIELAAARHAALGLDGLEAALADRLGLLTGGRRLDDRHRSLRTTLDWSYALLDDRGRAVLRRVSVFAGAFTAVAAAAVVADREPVLGPQVPAAIAGLAEQSLLVAVPGSGPTRYRALETVRQYGCERLEEAGEADPVRLAHLAWGQERVTALQQAAGKDEAWRDGFDQVADELRAALVWAAPEPRHRAPAHRLALTVAELSFLRGRPAESQRRYEQAAALSGSDAQAAAAWRSAAGAAESRHVGDDALRLRVLSAEAAVRAGDRAQAAADLARNAELINRGPGLMASDHPPEQVALLIARARELAGDDVSARARLLVAEACDRAVADPETPRLIERALALARQADDPLTESAALDQLTAVQLAHNEVRAAAVSARRRTELLAPLPVSALTALEHFDSFTMAADCAVAAGDLAGARELAERLRGLPFYREEEHLATARLLIVTVMAGDWDEAVDLAERFRAGWERAGRPRAGNLSRAAYAAATVHGLRGDERARAQWLEVVGALSTPGRGQGQIHAGEFFDAQVLLHQGRPAEAVRLMSSPPEELAEWFSGMWRPWYAALWAEAAVLAGLDEAGDRIARARSSARDNPVALLLVDRAELLLHGVGGSAELADARGSGSGEASGGAGSLSGPERSYDAAGRGGREGYGIGGSDHDLPRWPRLVSVEEGRRRDGSDDRKGRAGLLAVAAQLRGPCRYQWARTLVLLGGAERDEGEGVLRGMGAAAMVTDGLPG